MKDVAWLVWALPREGKLASCELRLMRIGVEVRILRNGSLLMSRIFSTPDEALAWEDEERGRLAAMNRSSEM